MMDLIDKTMKSYGFKKVKYPVGSNEYSIWYIKPKIPYSSSISKAQILAIYNELKVQDEKEIKVKIEVKGKCKRLYIPKGFCTIFLKDCSEDQIEISKYKKDVCIEILDLKLDCMK